MTSYELVISSEYGDEYIPLIAKTDDQARKAAAKYAAENPKQTVFCAFSRTSDAQGGYINREGASPTGSAY
jgi:hypothetical protein